MHELLQSRMWCTKRSLEMRRRPDLHSLWILSIPGCLKCVVNDSLLTIQNTQTKSNFRGKGVYLTDNFMLGPLLRGNQDRNQAASCETSVLLLLA